MRYTLVVRPSVTAEAARVYAYREAERPGSGEHFLEALGNCYARIKASPFGFQVRRGEYRHAILHRLKYRVVFRVKGDHIFVVQVRHTSRKGSKRFGP